eukprot:scaffold156745_cov32-Tisochrysis_lutea.AAC.4
MTACQQLPWQRRCSSVACDGRRGPSLCGVFVASSPNLFDLFPLWAIASHRAGGMGATKEELGILLLVAGLIHFVFTSSIMGRLVESDIRLSLVVAPFAAAVFVLAIPMLAASTKLVASIFSTILLSLTHNAILTGVTAAISASNTACEACPRHINALSGIVVQAEAVGKMLGPAFFAPLFAAAIAMRPLYSEPPPSSPPNTFSSLPLGDASPPPPHIRPKRP